MPQSGQIFQVWVVKKNSSSLSSLKYEKKYFKYNACMWYFKKISVICKFTCYMSLYNFSILLTRHRNKKNKTPKQTNKSKQNLLFLGYIDWLLPQCVYIFLIKYIKWIENNICPVKYTVLISIFFFKFQFAST